MMNERSSPGHSLAALLALAALSLPPAASAAGQEGVVAVRDRESGQLRTPTAAELRALRAQERAMLLPPPAVAPSVKRADGTRHLHLGERGMVHSVVRLDPDGSHAYSCVHGEHAAHAAVVHPQTREVRHERK